MSARLVVRTVLYGVMFAVSSQVIAEEERITFRPVDWGHVVVYPDNQIIDGQFCILGDWEPKGFLFRDSEGGVNGYPAYKFRLDGGRRIEISTAFCSESMAAKFPADYIEKLVKIRDTYRLSNLCEYGDTVTYDWYIKFPQPIDPESSGLISQWHGKPDKTLTRDPQGVMKYNTLDEFIELMETMNIVSEVNGGRATDKTTGEENGWRVDSYQRPVGALRFNNGVLNLVVRNDPHRLSNGSPHCKAGQGVPHTETNEDGVSATIVWERKIEELPVDRWIHLTFKVKWPTYSKTEDKVTSSGFVEFSFDDEKPVRWEGPVGKNDVYAPYFQFGVYTGSGDVEVHHSGYQMTVNKKNDLIPFGPE